MNKSNDEKIEDIILPPGFQSAGVHCGLKRERKDLALFYSEQPASVAATFTTNKVKAATVLLGMERLPLGSAQAIIVNSGNANACTGEQGMSDAKKMGEETATALGVPEESVFVCSTGHIGVPLPMDKIIPGIQQLAPLLTVDGGQDAAQGIMTTDKVVKHWTVEVEIDHAPVTITGIAKGAGMIEPNMATMLCFVLTDATIESEQLQTALRQAVSQSFNRITVDGDQSTNDTVLCLANKTAENKPLSKTHPDWHAFCEGLNEVTRELALKIVKDGEGANKLITIKVKGAESDSDADKAARAVGNSFLVKTGWAGDLNCWGRIMDTIGYSGAELDQHKVDISFNGLPATQNGLAVSADETALDEVVKENEFTVEIDLKLGSGKAVVYTCECTEEYVRINVK